jgi:hypothetical protein
MPGEMNHTSYVNFSQEVDRTTFLNLKHGQVRILRKPNTTASNSGKATSSAGIATALFGNTTTGGYHRYNPGNHEEKVVVNSLDDCILPESRSAQPPSNNSLQAAEDRRSETFIIGQPQILKRVVDLDAERPQQPSARQVVTPTSWTQIREARSHGDTQRGRERRGYRGRGRGDHIVNRRLRSNREPPIWRLSLYANAPTGKQQAQADDSSGWSMSGVPLYQRTLRPPENDDFLPNRPGFKRVVAWLDALDESSTKGVSNRGLDNEPHPEGYIEEFSVLSLGSRPPTPENCLNSRDSNTAARRRQTQRVLRNRDVTEISDAGGVKPMEMVYEEAKRKMGFAEVEDRW